MILAIIFLLLSPAGLQALEASDPWEQERSYEYTRQVIQRWQQEKSQWQEEARKRKLATLGPQELDLFESWIILERTPQDDPLYYLQETQKLEAP